MLSNIYPTCDFENRAACAMYLPYAQAALHYNTTSAAETLSRVTSLCSVAMYLRSQGRWKEAERLEAEVVATRVQVLGAENADTLSSMANLASIYWKQGR
jgi:hypothetical protein